MNLITHAYKSIRKDTLTSRWYPENYQLKVSLAIVMFNFPIGLGLWLHKSNCCLHLVVACAYTVLYTIL